MKNLILKIRWPSLFLYWTWLTYELLLSNPWEFFGREIAEAPPIQTSTGTNSFIIHFGSYGLLTVLIFLCQFEKNKKMRNRWIFVGFIHGLICESLQFFVPNRWPSWDDAIANTLGVVVAVFILNRLSSRGLKFLWDQMPS